MYNGIGQVHIPPFVSPPANSDQGWASWSSSLSLPSASPNAIAAANTLSPGQEVKNLVYRPFSIFFFFLSPPLFFYFLFYFFLAENFCKLWFVCAGAGFCCRDWTFIDVAKPRSSIRKIDWDKR
jgi:hypothetical protein